MPEIGIPKELIYEYDKYYVDLSGSTPDTSFFQKCSPFYAESYALGLIKYAVETRLGWSPIQMRDHLTMNLIDRLALRHVMKFIKFPVCCNPTSDLFYLAWRIYPETQTSSLEDLEITTFVNFLDGDLYKLPKEYFSGLEGIHRAGNCLSYVIENFHQFRSIYDMYSFFAQTTSAMRFLADYRLNGFCKDCYASPLEFLHDALPFEQRS